MKKQTTFITFGQDHVHIIDGVIFDYKCVATISDVTPAEGRELAFEYFNGAFCFEYPEAHFPFETLNRFYPRGLIEVPRWRENGGVQQ